jgi:hypothetical protein
MLLIRDIFYCKPGKVRPMVEKFLAMKKVGEKSGMRRRWTCPAWKLTWRWERVLRR